MRDPSMPEISRLAYTETLFEGKITKTKRDALIPEVVHRDGYSQRQVADYLNLHYATVSWLANQHDTRGKT